MSERKEIDPATTLRVRAEAKLRNEEGADSASLNGHQLEALVHDLRVHEIELELQNEELRRSQAALESLQARYLDLYAAAPVGYVTLDERGRIEDVNQQASAVLGIPRDRLPGQPLVSFIEPEDQQRYQQQISAALQTGQPQVCELRIKRRDGTLRWARVEQRTSDDGSGRAVRRTVVSDITETRKLQEDLSQAEHMASMGTLAAGLAHEVNNPLTYMLHTVESLQQELVALSEVAEEHWRVARQELDGDGLARLESAGGGQLSPAAFRDLSELAGHTVTGVLRIGEITNRLGNFARSKTGPAGLTDLNRAVEEAVAMAGHQVTTRAQLVTELGDVPLVLATEAQLTQILLNLIVNAAQSIEEGRAPDNRVSVRTWTDGPYALVSVQDTGCGIRPKDRESVFEPFFTTKGPQRGTGLGLAMVKRSVSELGGTIDFESAVGQGTRFIVRFPSGGAKPAASPQGTAPAASMRGRILVVDDEPMILRTIKAALDKQHDVVTARSGREAQHLLTHDSRFDVVLCDLVMPEVTGVELHAWLQERDPALARRMVMMTGGAFSPEIQAYLDTIDNPRFSKPFRIKALLDLIDAQLSAARSGR